MPPHQNSSLTTQLTTQCLLQPPPCRYHRPFIHPALFFLIFGCFLGSQPCNWILHYCKCYSTWAHSEFSLDGDLTGVVLDSGWWHLWRLDAWNSKQEETESTFLLHRVAIACVDWVCLSWGTRNEVGKTGAMFPGAMDPFQTLSLTNCVILAYFSPMFSQRGNRDDDLAVSHPGVLQYMGLHRVKHNWRINAKMVSIKDRNSMDLTEAEDIKKR